MKSDNFETIIRKEAKQCCDNKSIYEITYNLGIKWHICYACFELDAFNSDIKEKVRVMH